MFIKLEKIYPEAFLKTTVLLLAEELLFLPSKVSASSPDPAPSTVLISVRIS